MSSRVVTPEESWELHRGTIHDLYIGENFTLKQLADEMKGRGLHASIQQYARRLKRWEISKNKKGDDWKYVSRILRRRSLQSKPSIVFIHGREISPHTWRKETRRYDRPSLMPRDPTPEPMDHVRVCTPTNVVNANVSNSLTVFNGKQIQKDNPRQSDAHLIPILIENLLCLETIHLIKQNGDT